MDPPPAAMRAYRIRLVFSGSVVNVHRNPVLFLDLTPGPTLERARVQLDALLYSLTQEARYRRGTLGQHYLDVFGPQDDRTPEFQWHPTWVEPS
jgi:hypothetical protein